MALVTLEERPVMKISQLGEFPERVWLMRLHSARLCDKVSVYTPVDFLRLHMLGGYKACLSVVSVYVLMLTDLRLNCKVCQRSKQL